MGGMCRYPAFWWLPVMVWALGLGSAFGAGDVVVITQSVDAHLASTVSARLGRGHVVDGQIQLDVGARNLTDLSRLPLPAMTDFGVGLPGSTVLSRAAPFLTQQAEVFARNLETWMRARGAATAAYALRQTVRVAGSTSPRILSWQLLLEGGGRIRYSAPSLNDPAGASLEIRYTPLRLQSGLPQDWALPDAGVLRWRRLDNRLEPISGWTAIDTQGAYDEPVTRERAVADPDAGLNCLANRRRTGACAASIPDVQDLLDLTGTTAALVSYLRALSPLYDTTIAADGSMSQVARSAIEIKVREWQMSDCAGGRYRNAGTFGMELAARTDRYRVDLGGEARLLRTITEARMSPTADFDRSKSAVSGVSAAALANWLVDPDNPEGPLLPLASLPGVLSAAPITVSSTTPESFLHADLYHGWCGRAVSLRASCRPDGSVAFVVGGGSGVAHCAPDETLFDTLEWVLQPGVPLPGQIYPGGDRVPPLVWSWDGAGRVIFSHINESLRSGDGYLPGLQPFAAVAFFSGFGVNTRRNFPSGGPVSFWFEGFQCPSNSRPAGTFATISPRPADIGTTCLLADESAGPITACEVTGESERCNNYRPVEPAWTPSQQWPWRACDSTCTIGANE